MHSWGWIKGFPPEDEMLSDPPIDLLMSGQRGVIHCNRTVPPSIGQLASHGIVASLRVGQSFGKV